MRAKQGRNCLIGTSVGSIRRERDAKHRKSFQGRRFHRADEESVSLLVTNLPDFSRKKLESAFFRDRRDSIYKLNRVGAHANETNAHWINAGYSNFGIHLLFCLVSGRFFVTPPYRPFFRFCSNSGILLFAASF